MFKDITIEPTWKEALLSYFETESFKNLTAFIREERLTKTIYPKQEDIFKAFTFTPLPSVRVVILGQDPYHGKGQACGLCFSVEDGIPLPPSLKNIYKEIESDCDIEKDFRNGSLEGWAKQGVFLLNSVLSVVADTPASHKGRGWEEFTDTVIRMISEKQDHVVFMLWGNFAKGKKPLIDTKKHLILLAAHPSPFSAYSGFFGCKHFSKCNEYLKENGEGEIRW